MLPVAAVYVAVVRPQVTVGPEILDGVKGTLLTESDLAPEMPHVLPAFTVMLPLVNTLLFMLVLAVPLRACFGDGGGDSAAWRCFC